MHAANSVDEKMADCTTKDSSKSAHKKSNTASSYEWVKGLFNKRSTSNQKQLPPDEPLGGDQSLPHREVARTYTAQYNFLALKDEDLTIRKGKSRIIILHCW